MKRAASEVGGEAASVKKVKTEHNSAPASVPASASANGDGEWTKVEKRKKKKAARAEARDQVCTHLFCTAAVQESRLSWFPSAITDPDALFDTVGAAAVHVLEYGDREAQSCDIYRCEWSWRRKCTVSWIVLTMTTSVGCARSGATPHCRRTAAELAPR